jgi:hypothetical protein
MKRSKLILPLFLALAVAGLYGTRLQAEPSSMHPFGLGVELDGGPWPAFVGDVALSGKYWVNAYEAVDMDLGGGNNGFFTGADYLWHNYGVFKSWDVPLYYGVGAYTNVGDDHAVYGVGDTADAADDWGAGIRGKLGVDWLIHTTPWEVYGEIVPSLHLVNGVGFGLGVDAGGRFYF